MGVPAEELKYCKSKIEEFCQKRTGESEDTMYFYSMLGDSITVYEADAEMLKAGKSELYHLAQFRYNPDDEKWMLYYNHQDE
jgi:hypothetical protein